VHLDLRAAAWLTGEALNRGPSGGLEAECMRLVALRPSRVQHFEPDSFSAAFILRLIRRQRGLSGLTQPGIDRGSVCQLTQLCTNSIAGYIIAGNITMDGTVIQSSHRHPVGGRTDANREGSP
jgi:hypothetical protein